MNFRLPFPQRTKSNQRTPSPINSILRSRFINFKASAALTVFTDTLREGGILAYITTSGVMDSPQNRPVREWLVNHANLVSVIRLPDNLFVDAGTEVGSDLIVLQKNTRKSELTEKERNFIETRIISGGIHINNSYADLEHIVHTSVSMGKNMYGQPAMNFIHEGGVGTISEHLRQLLAQDVGNHLDRKLYEANLSRPTVSTILKTGPEIPPETTAVEHRQEMQEKSLLSTKPYEPMLNLFAAYADEEQTEVQVVESRPSPGRAPSASRKKKGDEPEMFNLFSQENMYDEAATQEDMTGERAAAEARWQERRQKIEEERKKEMEPRPFTGEIRPEYKNGSLVKAGEQIRVFAGSGHSRSTVPSAQADCHPAIPGRLLHPPSGSLPQSLQCGSRNGNRTAGTKGGTEPAV